MTDKVHKIKDWISKEQDGLIDAQGNFEYPEHEGAYHILCNLDTYIDSLQEDPVSDDLEEVAFDYAESCKYDGGEKLLCVEHFKAGAKWGKNQAMAEIQAQSMALAHGCPEENASNELKVAADNALESISDQYDIISVGSCLEMFRLGAKWQKEKDQETIETAIHHAYYNGKLEMKEQMMAKAINTEASLTLSVPSICISLPHGVNVGDKVKVIVIKED